MRWANTHPVQYDEGKSGYFVVSSGRAPASLGNIQLENFRLVQRNSPKILGLTCNPCMTWNQHINEVHGKSSRALGSILTWGNRNWGFNWVFQRLLYIVGVLPIMLYACTVWYTPGRSIRLLRPLIAIQRVATLRITGCYTSTSTEALSFEASLLPLDLAICKQADSDLACLLQLPDSHPSQKLI